VDKIFNSWVEKAIAEALALADSSDRLEIFQLNRSTIIAHYSCRGLVLSDKGRVEEHDNFVIGFHLADDYLRRATDSMQILSCISPQNFFHPNVRGRVCCIGKVNPGTSLVELLHRAYELISWQEVAPNEHVALNPAACSFARNHPERIPVDDRPLKRRPASFQLGELAVSS
jgi:hypothetical protein